MSILGPPTLGPLPPNAPPHYKSIMCVAQGLLADKIIPPGCWEAFTRYTEAEWENCTMAVQSNPKTIVTIKEKTKKIAPTCGVTGNYRCTYSM